MKARPTASDEMFRPGVRDATSLMTLICSRSSVSPLTAVTAIGTSCRRSSRFRAVTTTSSSWEESSAAGASWANAVPALSAMAAVVVASKILKRM